MAFRSASYLKSMISHLHGSSSLNYATAATSKLKAASPLQLGEGPGRETLCQYVWLGMIGLSTSFGLHTAMQQLRRAPNVHEKKSRRGTLPEITEPEHVAEEAEKFVNKSLFRKVAHIQEFASRRVIPDPRGEATFIPRSRVWDLENYRSGSNVVNHRLGTVLEFGCVLDFNLNSVMRSEDGEELRVKPI